MAWPWSKKEEEPERINPFERFDWYQPSPQQQTTTDSETYNPFERFDWYQPSQPPEPEPEPEPTFWDKAKSVVSKENIGNALANIKPEEGETPTGFQRMVGREKPTQDEPITPSIQGMAGPQKVSADYIEKNRKLTKEELSQLTGYERMIRPADPQLKDDLYAGMGDVSNSFYRSLQSIGGDKIPGVKDFLQYGVDSAQSAQAGGGTGIGSQVVRTIPRTAMGMGLAYMNPAAAAETLGANATLEAVKQFVSNPAFLNSALQSYGSTYGEARDEGATRGQAIRAGIMNAIPNAAIEVSGGVEQLPNKAGQSLLKTIGQTALEEGMEEIAQYPFETLAKMGSYNPNMPWVSAKDQAVINPLQMGQAGLVGGLAGGLLGGVGGAFNSAFNTQANVDTNVENQPAYQPPSDNVFYADPYGNVTQDSDFRPFLQLPPGSDFQAQPQADFYTDPYGNTRTELAPLQLQLPEPSGVEFQADVRDTFSPNRLTPGNLDALNRRGIFPNVTKQSDSLSMLNPPIAEPDYQAATGQIETPNRIFPGERITPLEEMLKPLSDMQHPAFDSPVDSNVRIEGKNPFDVFQTSQDPFTDVQQDIQSKLRARAETAASAEPDTFTVDTNEGTRAYNSKEFVDNKGKTLETYINEDPVYRDLTDSLEGTSSQPDNYIQNHATDIKDKSGAAYNIDHPFRGLQNAFGKHWDYVKKNYFDTFDKSKGNYAREVETRANAIYDEVVKKHNIKKGSKESAAIQWLGEGERIVGSDKNFMNKLFNPEYETITNDAGQEVKIPKMEKYTLKDLKRDFPNKWQDIVESEKIFRQQYDEMIDLINESRKKVYPSVEKQVAETEQRVKDLNSDIAEYRNRLENKSLAQNEIKEINRKIDEMSKKSAELSDQLKNGELWRNKRLPKRKNYFRHFKEMNSGVVGLFNIIENPSHISSNLAGISEYTKPKSKWASFMQQRGLGDYTADAVGGFLDYLRPASHAIHIDPHITKFRQLAKDIADGTQNTRNANNLILFLNDYANSLAGKTNKFDRIIQDMIPGGRKTFAAINWFNSRARANAVLGNLRSSITQVANIPAGISEVNDPIAITKGMGETMANIIGKGNKAIDQSDFITERYMDSAFEKFDTKLTKKPKQFAAWLLGLGDELGTRLTWNSAYQKALKDGMPNPMKYADDLTRNVVAGRGIGEVPLLQQSKLFQTFFPFQLEVGNLAHVVGKQVKGKEFSKLMTMMVGSYLFNAVAESLYGDRPLPDPIDAMIDALSQENPTTLSVAGRLGGEVLSNIPGGQTIASLWPEYETDVSTPLGEYSIPSRQQLFGDSDPTRFGSGFLLQEAIKDPFYKLALPWGGSQLKKTMQGVEALNEGGVIRDDKLRFLTPPTTENVIKSTLFGRNATPEAREYFDQGRKPLSEKQTQQAMQSSDPKAEYERFIQQREINKLQQKLKEVGKNRELSTSERDKQIIELRNEIEKLRAAQR